MANGRYQYNNNGYGGRPNPYAQGDSYEQPMGGQAMGSGEMRDVEMEPLTGAAQQFNTASDPNPNYVLNACSEIDDAITDIQSKIAQMEVETKRSMNDTDASANSVANRNVERLNNDIMAAFRELTGHMKRIKQKPEANNARNAPQVGRVERRLKEMRQTYLNSRTQFERNMREQSRRQIMIVNPDASEAEINAIVDDPSNTQIFSQALMQSNRRGQAQSAMNAVSDRHAAIQRIEQQIIELADMFTQMDELVVQQEVAVAQIEQKGEEVQDNLYKGNEEISTAIESARSRNRKKWWCLGLVVAIVVAAVIIGVVYYFINKPATTVVTAPTTTAAATRGKRDIANDVLARSGLDHAVVPNADWQPTPDSKRDLPIDVLSKLSLDRAVVPDKEWSNEKRELPMEVLSRLALDRAVVRGKGWTPTKTKRAMPMEVLAKLTLDRAVVPGSEWSSPTNDKRALSKDVLSKLALDRAVVPGSEWSPATNEKRELSNEVLSKLTLDRAVVPGSEWSPPTNEKRAIPMDVLSKLTLDRAVKPGEDWTPGKRSVAFQA